MDTNSPQHDDAIVPVKAGLRAALKREEPAAAPRRLGRFVASAVGSVLLVVGVLAAFVWLPDRVESSRTNPAAVARDPTSAAPAVPSEPPLSAAEAARLRDVAERLLAGLLTQESELKAQGVEAWGGDDWQRYQELLRRGADALLGNDPRSSVDRYTAADSLGEALRARGRQTIEGALQAAATAFAAGNSALAIAQYDIVLGIDANDAVAKAGRERALRLPEVLAAMQRADDARARGDLDAALAGYKSVLALDSAWEAARVASGDVAATIASTQFERTLSAAYAALDKQDFATAEQQFRAALALRPSAKAAADGLEQAEQGSKLDKIELTEARALAFERRELWEEAIAQYRGVLETDAGLVFAQQGLARSQTRAGLDSKLNRLIENPTLLFGDAVLADARKLLDEAKSMPEAGPRLTRQVRDLDRLIELAATPLAVRLESDQLTEVTLYRIGALGQFAAKEVELRPGTYTAIGSRDGYRDVRRTFTVIPGRVLEPISVICAERI